jgi:hypothetical protein
LTGVALTLVEIATEASDRTANAAQKKTPQKGRFMMLQCTSNAQAAFLKRKFYVVKTLD